MLSDFKIHFKCLDLLICKSTGHLKGLGLDLNFLAVFSLGFLENVCLKGFYILCKKSRTLKKVLSFILTPKSRKIYFIFLSSHPLSPSLSLYLSLSLTHIPYTPSTWRLSSRMILTCRAHTVCSSSLTGNKLFHLS